MAKTISMKRSIEESLWAAGMYDLDVQVKPQDIIRVRRSYNYRPVETLTEMAQRVLRVLQPLGYEVARMSDDWARWPKASYFTVDLKPTNVE